MKKSIWLSILGVALAVATAFILKHIHQTEGFQFKMIIPGLFFAVGLFGLAPSPLWAWLYNKDCMYAITSTRAIILAGNHYGSLQVRFFTPHMMYEIMRRESKNGCGDLIITHDTQTGRHAGSVHKIPVGFMNIPDVRNVEKILCRMRDQFIFSPE